ncbi:MAG: hypothetical protein Q9219_006776 [cf. Caloplaca sp. 3 TL-2023]
MLDVILYREPSEPLATTVVIILESLEVNHESQLPNQVQPYRPAFLSQFRRDIRCALDGLEAALQHAAIQGSKLWLVGGKCTYADLAFVMWFHDINWSNVGDPPTNDINAWPYCKKWMDKTRREPAVQCAFIHIHDDQVFNDGTFKLLDLD